MTSTFAIAGVIAVFMMIYLVYSIIYPERF